MGRSNLTKGGDYLGNKSGIERLIDMASKATTIIRRGMNTAMELQKLRGKKPSDKTSDSIIDLEHIRFLRFYANRISDSSAGLNLRIPEATSRFDCLSGIASTELGYNDLWQVCKRTFACESPWGDDLATQIDTNFLLLSPHFFRVSMRVEADEEYLGMSAAELGRKNLPVITLAEFMILELQHFDATNGGHLNLITRTLCAGTRFRDGTVPIVSFERRRVVFDWVKPTEASPDTATRLVVR